MNILKTALLLILLAVVVNTTTAQVPGYLGKHVYVQVDYSMLAYWQQSLRNPSPISAFNAELHVVTGRKSDLFVGVRNTIDRDMYTDGVLQSNMGYRDYYLGFSIHNSKRSFSLAPIGGHTIIVVGVKNLNVTYTDVNTTNISGAFPFFGVGARNRYPVNKNLLFEYGYELDMTTGKGKISSIPFYLQCNIGLAYMLF